MLGNVPNANVEGTCWIQFELVDWIEIETAFSTQSQDLYRFIEEECHVELRSRDEGEPDENDEYWIEGENLIWSASVRFPKERLRTFEKVIRTTLVDSIPDSEEEPKIH